MNALTCACAAAGDKTEQLLWRLQNGELPATKHPKVVVVMIGTNGVFLPSLSFHHRIATAPKCRSLHVGVMPSLAAGHGMRGI